MNKYMWNDTIKCPVCKKEQYVSGMANHIIGRAKSELYEYYFKRIEKTPHLEYTSANTELRKIKRLKLTLK